LFNLKNVEILSKGLRGEVNGHVVTFEFASGAWAYPVSIQIDGFPYVWGNKRVASQIIEHIDDPFFQFILELSDKVTWTTRIRWVDRYLKEKDIAKVLDKTLLGIQISVGKHWEYPDYALFKVQYFRKTLEKYSANLPDWAVAKWKRTLDELENRVLAASLSR